MQTFAKGVEVPSFPVPFTWQKSTCQIKIDMNSPSIDRSSLFRIGAVARGIATKCTNYPPVGRGGTDLTGDLGPKGLIVVRVGGMDQYANGPVRFRTNLALACPTIGISIFGGTNNLTLVGSNDSRHIMDAH